MDALPIPDAVGIPKSPDRAVRACNVIRNSDAPDARWRINLKIFALGPD